MAITRFTNDRRFRFLIAGGSAAALNWLVRFPLGLAFPFWISILISQAIGMLYGFVIFRSWVFTGFRERSVFLQLLDFLWVNAAGAVTMAAVAIPLRALLVMTVTSTSVADPLAHAVGIAAGAVVNYLGHRHFTFRT